MSDSDNCARQQRARYHLAWRWHFYAGLVVLPFLLILAATGLVMVYNSSLASPSGPVLSVAPADTVHDASALLYSAQRAVPDGRATQYAPPANSQATAQVVFDTAQGAVVADLDPYRNTVLRLANRDRSVYAWAHRIHGTLLLGEVGDFIIETVAGLTLLLVVTGLYMWWLRRDSSSGGRRASWLRWHRSSGLYAALGLLFFLLSGLAWTNVWGGKMVQAWGSFPAEKWGPVGLSTDTHSAMNHGSQREVPWGLEQTPMPASHVGHARTPLPLAEVQARAEALGFGPRYRINLPADSEGVYTLSANTMSGDIRDPRHERTVHLDQYSGEVLGEVGFADYSLLAKSMAAGVGLHQGSLGPLNSAFNALACLVVIFLCFSGAWMWWLRRPSRVSGLRAPPRPLPPPGRNGMALILLLCGLAFPLLGLALLTGIALDRLYLRRKELLPQSR
ncbi:PepSY-associated TM helix domain-containing protein [Parahaliea aestuarii]|uniref:PepSY domain-containing protein n=1 Tax=Parahaliea aestuarii TaxID=1852021 RepID=A0A5C8ZTA0_9GAMM|nr:PepSY domain-containing protein [Parahaliea aestuarii]TXS91676.1 PepSY domain-containing protein [Parahaliea aestuarii]